MRRLFILGILNLFTFPLIAQSLRYRVCFTDKMHNQYSLNRPEEFLSALSLQRREHHSIPIDSLDLPLSDEYLNGIRTNHGLILGKSKWLNEAVVSFTDTTDVVACSILPYVKSIELVESATPKTTTGLDKFGWTESTEFPETIDTGAYTYAFRQAAMLNVPLMHSMGYTGDGIRVAVLDVGFNQANSMDCFQQARSQGRLHPIWNYYSGDTNVFQMGNHGTLCLSTMAAQQYGTMTGTAPDADFYLFVSEEGSQENPVEEDFWAAAAEKADSLGVDMISSSLGYNIFDDGSMNHTYSDMNGHTTIAARAANIAYSRGILVVVSAGNEGDHSWHYIGTPADADSAIAVGAVAGSELIAGFSSRGPSSDGDVKPNLCAEGLNATVMNTDNTYLRGSGTSFACPILAGAIACLWQSSTDANVSRIRDVIQRSGDRFYQPDSNYGFGIPDLYTAFYLLKSGNDSLPETMGNGILLFPNPVLNSFNISFRADSAGSYQLDIINAAAQSILHKELYLLSSENYFFNSTALNSESSGLYTIRIVGPSGTKTRKIIRY